METLAVKTTLTGALGAIGPQLVAFVGAGGKTTALQALARELSAQGSRVLATTTTAMFGRQLSSMGPLLLEADDAAPFAPRVREALRDAGLVALARSRITSGKVKGLPPSTVDSLWEAGLAEALVVEADGSRGLPLKAFGVAEPQLPSRTTLAVVLAGLDAVGAPLDEDHVQRAGLLTSILGVAPGDRVTAGLVGRAVALQIARVRSSAPGARVVVLMNKADDDARVGLGTTAAAALLATPDGPRDAARPDRIVVGSVVRNVYRVLD